MSIPDYHIQRHARAYAEEHGECAAVKAQRRAADLDARGDTIGADMWKRIASAIEERQRQGSNA